MNVPWDTRLTAEEGPKGGRHFSSVSLCTRTHSPFLPMECQKTCTGTQSSKQCLQTRGTRRRTLISSDFRVVLWTLHRSDGHQVLSGEDIAVEAKKGQEPVQLPGLLITRICAGVTSLLRRTPAGTDAISHDSGGASTSSTGTAMPTEP
ncbi:hypothetical protein CB1_001133005 [Camelus ferus]|nr:hypothetical protein CB1_001133005 [Camelus ferus]